MKTLKLKVGDIAIITDNYSGHEFDNGDEVRITHLCIDGKYPHYQAENTTGDINFWFIDDNDCKKK